MLTATFGMITVQWISVSKYRIETTYPANVIVTMALYCMPWSTSLK